MTDPHVLDLYKRVSAAGGGRVMTKQSEKDQADINVVMSKYLRTGVVPVSGRRPQYGDFSNAPDYLTAKQAIVDAEREFAALPAPVRKACDNDPGKFLDLVMDPERRSELEKLGLVEAQVPAAAAASPPATETAVDSGGEIPPPSK